MTLGVSTASTASAWRCAAPATQILPRATARRAASSTAEHRTNGREPQTSRRIRPRLPALGPWAGGCLRTTSRTGTPTGPRVHHLNTPWRMRMPAPTHKASWQRLANHLGSSWAGAACRVLATLRRSSTCPAPLTRSCRWSSTSGRSGAGTRRTRACISTARWCGQTLSKRPQATRCTRGPLTSRCSEPSSCAGSRLRSGVSARKFSTRLTRSSCG